MNRTLTRFLLLLNAGGLAMSACGPSSTSSSHAVDAGNDTGTSSDAGSDTGNDSSADTGVDSATDAAGDTGPDQDGSVPTGAACTPVNDQPGPLTPGPDLSDDARGQTIVAVSVAVKALAPLADRQKDAEAVRAAVSNLPNVVDTGISSDCSVWLRLTDGSSHVVVADTRQRFGPGDADPLALAGPAPRSWWQNGLASIEHAARDGLTAFEELWVGVAHAAAGKPYALPGSGLALLGQADNLGPHSLASISAALQSRGYLPTTDVTTEGLRSKVSGVGVFWISTHGAVTKDNAGVSRYVLITDETPDPTTGKCALDAAACAKNRDDIHANRAGTGTLRTDGSSFFFINDLWVTKYWSFAPNSLVVLDACNSMDDFLEYSTFRFALKSKGAGTVVGWHSEVDKSSAEVAMAFLFDRALGANAVEVPSPKQRPFSVPEVFAAMQKSGKTHDPKGSAVLDMVQNAVAPAILAPSIQNLGLVEKTGASQLTVNGEFGKDQGTLEIAQAPVSLNWDSSELVYDSLPNSGAGSKGSVQVRVKLGAQTIVGNSVPLTDFAGTYRARNIQSKSMGPPGPWAELDCSNLHFRDDVHEYRLAPEEAAMGGTVNAQGQRDSRVSILNVTADSVCTGKADSYGDLVAGGTTTEFTYVTTSTLLPWIDNQASSKPSTGWFFVIGNIDTKNHALTLAPDDLLLVTFKTQKISPPPAGPVNSIPNLPASVSALDPTLSTMPIQLDSSYAGSQGSTTFTLTGIGDQGQLQYDLKADPTTLPDSNTEG